jgi:hypothetical protein
MVKDYNKMAYEILEAPYWPKDLSSKESYFRTHDDCDGELHKGIAVGFTCDGDAWIYPGREPYRYRMPCVGGGRSPRVRNALLLLALAIKLDNEEFPI